MVELFLDLLQPTNVMKTDLGRKVDQNIMRSRVLVLSSFLTINLFFYISLSMKNADYARLASLFHSIMGPHVVIVIGGVFCSMFDQKFYNSTSTITLGISLEKVTTINLIIIIISQIFYLFSLWSKNELFYFLSTAFALLYIIISIFTLYKIFLYLYREAIATSFNFEDSLTMRHFFNALTVATFALAILVFGVSTKQWYVMNSFANLSVEALNGYQYIQIFTIIVFHVVKARMFLRAVHIRTDRLRTRLDLMRYISHEIRSEQIN
jgi:hypothetical protein